MANFGLGCCCTDICTETYPIFINVTQVVGFNGEEGTLRDPYPRPSGSPCAGVANCDGLGEPACGGWTSDWPDGPVDHNTYAATVASVTIDTCSYGWKAVRARKIWHGRIPFGEMDACNGVFTGGECAFEGFNEGCFIKDEVPVPTLTRYLTCERHVEWEGQLGGQLNLITIHLTGSVDRYSGVLSVPTCVETYTVDGEPFEGDWTTNDWRHHVCQMEVDCEGNFSCPGTGSNPTTAIVLAYINDPDGAPDGWTVSASWSDTSIVVAIDVDYGGGSYESLSITILLTEEYTSAMLISDVEELLAEWDLSDHAQYQWRQDATCSLVPLVIRDEHIAAGNPDVGGVHCPIDPPPADGPTGEVLGAPNPPGYAPHFQFRHETYHPSDLACLITNGAFSPIPPATYWTNEVEQQVERRGGWLKMGIGNAAITAQKWAETIMEWPSANDARGCGAEGEAQSPPTSHYVVKTWSFDFRIPGENGRLIDQWGFCNECGAAPHPDPVGPDAEIVEYVCSDVSYTPSALPRWYVAAFTPNGEVWAEGGTNHPWGTLICDITYGGYWLGLIEQAMIDPYFTCRFPEADPEESPIVEARCAEISGESYGSADNCAIAVLAWNEDLVVPPP